MASSMVSAFAAVEVRSGAIEARQRRRAELAHGGGAIFDPEISGGQNLVQEQIGKERHVDRVTGQ